MVFLHKKCSYNNFSQGSVNSTDVPSEEQVAVLPHLRPELHPLIQLNVPCPVGNPVRYRTVLNVEESYAVKGYAACLSRFGLNISKYLNPNAPVIFLVVKNAIELLNLSHQFALAT
jgi:hypothetical protein